ncbi:TPA: acyltransferase [Photobacterium damselae]
MNENHIPSLELGRIIAIFAVVIIHSQAFNTLPLINGEPWLGYLLNQSSRFAVPLFFLISGYLIAPKLIASPQQTACSYSIPLLKVWLIWSIIYLIAPFNLNTVMQEGYLQERMGYWQYLSENPINSLFEGGLVHLWFIPALICAVILIAFFIRFNKIEWLLPFALLLFVYGLLAGSYQPYTDLDSIIFTRNGPFFATLMVGLGFEYRRQKWQLSNTIALLLFIGGMSLHLTEAFMLSLLPDGLFNIHDFLLGTPLWGLGIFILLLNHPNIGNTQWVRYCAKHTLGIYVLHLLLIIYFMNISMMLNLNPWVSNILIIPTTYCVSLIIISLIDKTRLKHILLR